MVTLTVALRSLRRLGADWAGDMGAFAVRSDAPLPADT